MQSQQSHEAMVKEFMALKQQNEALKAQLAAKPVSNGLGIKVSTKGAVSVYGLGRFPITLYSSQWEALLAKSDAIKTFLKDNSAALKTKEA